MCGGKSGRGSVWGRAVAVVQNAGKEGEDWVIVVAAPFLVVRCGILKGAVVELVKPCTLIQLQRVE